ncbi:hypothetical protein [Helicobacter sp. T3_23-1059]
MKIKNVAIVLGLIMFWIIFCVLYYIIDEWSQSNLENKFATMIEKAQDYVMENDLDEITQEYLQARQELINIGKEMNEANTEKNKKVGTYPQVFENIDSNMLNKIEIIENKYLNNCKELVNLMTEHMEIANKMLRAQNKAIKAGREVGKLIENPQISTINEMTKANNTLANEITLLANKAMLAVFEIRKLRDRFTFSNNIENTLYKAYAKISKYENEVLSTQKKLLEKQGQFFEIEIEDSEFLKVAKKYETVLKKYNSMSQKYIGAINEFLKVVDEAKASVGAN